MDKRLQNKVVLVTGSGGLIGPCIVRRLAAEGATLAVTDLLQENADAIAIEINSAGGNAVGIKLDVSDMEQASGAFELAEQALGPIDILVHNAAWKKRPVSRFHLTPDEVWRKVIDIDLNGTLICCKLALTRMIERRSGKIINITSIAGITGLIDRAEYAAAKGGVIAFSKTLAMEAGPFGVTVNCVSPGMIGPVAKPSDGTWLGRSGIPDDIAAMVAFLASPEGDYITGCNYAVDGGRTVGPKGAK